MAGQVHDMEVLAVATEGGHEERARVAGGVRLDEERVGGEGPPVPADGAEVADLLGREPHQHVEQHLQRQDAVGGAGGGGG
uniref:Uncharacterized protein n=1 Tax=Arundo donax TaxID=35708 RepID=A0A0A9CGU9_ARUDO